MLFWPELAWWLQRGVQWCISRIFSTENVSTIFCIFFNYIIHQPTSISSNLFPFCFHSVSIPFPFCFHFLSHFITIPFPFHPFSSSSIRLDFCLFWRLFSHIHSCQWFRLLQSLSWKLQQTDCLSYWLIVDVSVCKILFLLEYFPLPFHFHSVTITFSFHYHFATIPFPICYYFVSDSITIPSPFCLHSIIIFNLFPFCHHSVITQSPLYLHSLITPFYYHSNSIPFSSHYHTILSFLTIYIHSITIPYKLVDCWLIHLENWFFLTISATPLKNKLVDCCHIHWEKNLHYKFFSDSYSYTHYLLSYTIGYCI